MLRKKSLFAVLAVLMALAIVLSGCAKGGATGPEINMNLNTEPPTADPSLATDTTSVQVDELLFLGLTDFDDQTLDVIPELATEWSVSADGLEWTFKMRDDAFWVRYNPENGKVEKLDKVTAHDVAYGVKRTIDPNTASDYAYVDYIIKNAYAVNTGESTDLDSVGVEAVDDFTVKFTLEQPAGYFPGIAGMWINRPQPREAIETFGEKWTEPGNIVTNGSYVMTEWAHESHMTMIKNPHHFDAKDVQIAKINWAMVVEESTAFAMYENGELDVANAPLADIDRIKADATLSSELYIAPDLCTYYYGFNNTKPPFDNKLVRQAFSAAIDRQKLIDTVLKGEQKVAKTFACPGIFGSPAEDPAFEGITFDPAKAKQLLADAGYPNGEGLPEITLMINTSEGHQKIAEFIQASWKENLGVEVQVANQEWAVYLKTVHEDSPQVYRMGWCADYPDENNWVAEVFHPIKGSNEPKWDPESDSAKRFMQLVEDAALSSDPEERARLYYEAEQILTVDEAVIAPIYYYTRVVLTKPYVNRTYAPLGGEHIDKWSVEGK
ncbi:MAG: peptide ABC transporter substrate-binding protein [Chloroflexi bacterium]|nr:peptide ABC transporter substrate-binding protein [Chloroflexota bacterium]